MLRRLILIAGLALAASTAQAQMSILGYGQGAVGTPPVPMITPLMFSGNTANNPSATVLNYVPMFGATGANNFSSSSTGKPTVMPVTGIISGLEVYFQTDPTPGSYDVGLTIGGVQQTLVCNIPAAGHACSDLTHSVNVAPGNLVGWFICPSTVGNTNACPLATGSAAATVQAAPLQISAIFTSSSGQTSLIGGGSTSTNMSTTVINYAGWGTSGAWGATENLVSVVVPTGGVLDTLYVNMTGTSGASSSYDFILVKNGTPSALTCNIAHPATTCNTANGTNPISVVQGDTITIESCPSNAVTCTAGSAPGSSRGAMVSLRWVPTTSGQAIVMDTPSTVPGTNTTAVFMPNSGAGNPQTTEANQVNIVPAFPAGKTFSINNLTVAQCPGPGAAATRVDTLRLGNAGGALSSQSLAATMPNGTTACPTFSTATATGAVTATAGQIINWQTQNSSTNTTLTTLKIGATINIQ